MFTFGENVSVQITEKKSVFYADAFYVRSEDEALSVLDSVRNKYPDATHHVYAYSLRDRGIKRFSDAGEPSGTAGMPVLKVIEYNGLVDACVVVTRYFGGILLGAGVLVRAYTKAAAEAVEAAGRAEIKETVKFFLEYGYDLHNQVLRMLDDYGAKTEKKDFTDKIYLESSLEAGVFEKFAGDLENRYYGCVFLQIIERFMSRQM